MKLKRNKNIDSYSALKNGLLSRIDEFSDGEILLMTDNNDKSYICVKNFDKMDVYDMSSYSNIKFNPNKLLIDVTLSDGNWAEANVKLDGYNVFMSKSNYNVHNSYSTLTIKIYDIPNFKLYINSYAEGNYDYVVAYALDYDKPSSIPSYKSPGVISHTRGNQKSPSGGISNFTEVSYANDGGEHTIYIAYRKDSSASSNNDRGYVAISNEYEINIV